MTKLNLSLGTSAERLSELQEEWDGRLDPEAVSALEDSKRIFTVGYFIVLLLVVGTVVFTVVGLPVIGGACAAVAFAVWIPASIRSLYLLSRMNKSVARRYEVEGRFRPPLTFRALSSTAQFDRWLLTQRNRKPKRTP